MKKLPVYKLVINEEDESGVSAIALVDDPAIERNFVAFNKLKPLVFHQVGDRQILTGPLMVADLPIYRRDPEKGEYYVIFDRATIEQIVYKFFRNKNVGEVNQMHDPMQPAEGVFMFESMIIDKARGIVTPQGFDEMPDGSWFGSFRVDNPEIWDNFIKTGDFKGFSVEGVFDMVEVANEDEAVIQGLIDIIQNPQ